MTLPVIGAVLMALFCCVDMGDATAAFRLPGSDNFAPPRVLPLDEQGSDWEDSGED